jgi:hypothetical protein
MTSLQVVNIDYYLGKSFLQRPFVPTHGNCNTGADPTGPGLDLVDASVLYPIIRIFGTLQETGKTACAHIHGVSHFLSSLFFLVIILRVRSFPISISVHWTFLIPVLILTNRSHSMLRIHPPNII